MLAGSPTPFAAVGTRAGTGNDADTSSQISALWSEMTGGGVSLTQQIDLATQLNDLITKRYQAEGQAVSTLTDQVKQLRDYVQSLKAGDLSTETPSEKLADAAQLYADTLAKAQGGDQTAIGNLTTAADSYLKLAQTYYASSDTRSRGRAKPSHLRAPPRSGRSRAFIHASTPAGFTGPARCCICSSRAVV